MAKGRCRRQGHSGRRAVIHCRIPHGRNVEPFSASRVNLQGAGIPPETFRPNSPRAAWRARCEAASRANRHGNRAEAAGRSPP